MEKVYPNGALSRKLKGHSWEASSMRKERLLIDQSTRLNKEVTI